MDLYSYNTTTPEFGGLGITLALCIFNTFYPLQCPPGWASRTLASLSIRSPCRVIDNRAGSSAIWKPFLGILSSYADAGMGAKISKATQQAGRPSATIPIEAISSATARR